MDAAGSIDPEFAKRHASFLAYPDPQRVDLLFLGDSITAGWFWGEHREVWDRTFGRFRPANFGIGGDRTEHVLWRIENGELDHVRPRVVVLLIGTNNIGDPASDILAGVTAVARRIHDKLPESRLLLLGIFPRGANPADPAVAEQRAKIREVNAGLKKLDDGRQTRFMDLSHLFLTPDGNLPPEIMPDALHLSRRGYEIWAQALRPVLEAMMQ